MTKRLGEKMMEQMEWIPGTALGSKAGLASEYMVTATTAESGNWDRDVEPGLTEIRYEVGLLAAKTGERMQSLWQC